MEFYMVFYPDGIYNTSVIIGRKIPDIPAIHRENTSFHPSSVVPCGGRSVAPTVPLVQLVEVICKEKSTFGNSSIYNFTITF